MINTTCKDVSVKNETLEFLKEYQLHPTNQLRNQLVKMNVGLVRKEVYHWLNKCNEAYDDLLQVGCIGLIRAIDRFDVSKGNAFSSFATPYIRGEIQHYLRDKSPTLRIPRNWLALDRQASKVTQELRMSLKRKPTESEVAEALNISLTEWQEIQLACSNRSPLSLDAPVAGGDDEEGTSCLGELVPDQQYRSFQLAQEDQIRLQQGLARLEEGTRKVLEFVFLFDLTQKETAERLGISSVTVSRRVKKGLTSLKEIIGEDEDY